MTLIELEKMNESDLSYIGDEIDDSLRISVWDSLRFAWDENKKYVPTNFFLIDNI